MASHRYSVGQSLFFSGRRMGHQVSAISCTIVRLMPAEGGENQYRIKCTFENTERIVREHQLSLTE